MNIGGGPVPHQIPVTALGGAQIQNPLIENGEPVLLAEGDTVEAEVTEAKPEGRLSLKMPSGQHFTADLMSDRTLIPGQKVTLSVMEVRSGVPAVEITKQSEGSAETFLKAMKAPVTEQNLALAREALIQQAPFTPRQFAALSKAYAAFEGGQKAPRMPQAPPDMRGGTQRHQPVSEARAGRTPSLSPEQAVFMTRHNIPIDRETVAQYKAITQPQTQLGALLHKLLELLPPDLQAHPRSAETVQETARSPREAVRQDPPRLQQPAHTSAPSQAPPQQIPRQTAPVPLVPHGRQQNELSPQPVQQPPQPQIPQQAQPHQRSQQPPVPQQPQPAESGQENPRQPQAAPDIRGVPLPQRQSAPLLQPPQQAQPQSVPPPPQQPEPIPQQPQPQPQAQPPQPVQPQQPQAQPWQPVLSQQPDNAPQAPPDVRAGTPPIRDIIETLFTKIMPERARELPSEMDIPKQAREIGRLLSAIMERSGSLPEQIRSDVMNTAREIVHTLKFAEQIGHCASFAQLPVTINGERTTAQLYVFNDSAEKKRIDPQNATLFVSLATANLDTVEGFVKMIGTGVEADFTLRSEEAADLFRAGLPELSELLEARGYRLERVNASVIKDEPKPPAAVEKGRAEMAGRYKFNRTV
jgi:hypothetical protein